MADKTPKTYSREEERINIASHIAGGIIALGGMLYIFLFMRPEGAAAASVAIYGTTLVLMYASSAFYHSRPNPSPARVLGRKFDHCAIYLLIAGTYTPILLLAVKGATGMWFLIFVWICAASGIVLKFFFTGRFSVISTLLYLMMGWLVVFFFNRLMHGMSGQAFAFLLAGGISYSLGAVFYLLKVKFSHALWHLFVLAGSTLQFFCVAKLI